MHYHQVIDVGNIKIGHNNSLVLIAGPCVLENEAIAFEIAEFLKKITDELKIPYIFKGSYDKANRTSINAFRGPGLSNGLKILNKIKKEFDIPVLSDVHRFEEIDPAAEVLDIIQIPAFLCRQTDFLLSVAKTNKPVNVKKGQFMAPWDMVRVAEKIKSTGNEQILFTERGSVFGYNNLVVDFRGLKIMRDTGFPVIFDATHSVQLPGGQGTSSGGQREFASVLARAAVATGVDAIFMEVYPEPDKALCDGPNSIKLEDLKGVLTQLLSIRKAYESTCSESF